MFLLKYLQQELGLSRRKFTSLVDEKKILVNKEKVEKYKEEVESGDEIIIEGKALIVEEKQQKSDLIMFHKPKGYVCSKSDPFNQTIYEILPKQYHTYYYIGRLDKDSHGLVLLTNSSELVHQMEHPSFGIEKEYIITVNKPVNTKDLLAMKKGVSDEGDLLRCIEVKRVEDGNILNILLNEGKKRHIRRMLKVLGYEVLDLMRIREGKYEIGNLEEGKVSKI